MSLSRHESSEAASVAGYPVLVVEPAASDERFAQRRPSRLPGYILATGASIPVVIRDSSSSGAQLEIVPMEGDRHPSHDRLPKRFTLSIPMHYSNVECEIAWQNGIAMGVRYVGPTQNYPRPKRVQKPAPQKGSLLGFLGIGKS